MVAAICHGPQVLAAADLVDGRRIAGFTACRDDVITMGARYDFAWPAMIDGSIVTAASPTTSPNSSTPSPTPCPTPASCKPPPRRSRGSSRSAVKTYEIPSRRTKLPPMSLRTLATLLSKTHTASLVYGDEVLAHSPVWWSTLKPRASGSWRSPGPVR